jgi:DNA-binding response OmpR family regulator
MKDNDTCNRLAGWRVLLIEDESLVAMLLEDALVGVGCEVIGLASRFYDAEQKAKSLSFDVAVLDVNLNGKQTLPIAEILLGRGIPFVFATGYGVGFRPAHFETVPVLQKPFEQHELEMALRAALSMKT